MSAYLSVCLSLWWCGCLSAHLYPSLVPTHSLTLALTQKITPKPATPNFFVRLLATGPSHLLAPFWLVRFVTSSSHFILARQGHLSDSPHFWRTHFVTSSSYFILARQGHLIAPFLAHAFCNFMGLPDLGFLAEKHQKLSVLYDLRMWLLAAYLVGIGESQSCYCSLV